MTGIDQLVGCGQTIEERRQVTLREWMQGNARLVQQENRTFMSVSTFNQEDEIETQKPLKTSAATFKLDLLWPFVIRYPDAEVVTISFKAETVFALFPP